MPQYEQIDWKKGECFGIGTDIFYAVEEERHLRAFIYINAVRTLCARCPIFQDCLSYGFANEDYGVWGGLTTMERRAMLEPKRYPSMYRRALFDLEAYGITYDMIMEAYEHTLNDGSMENKSANDRKNGVAGHSRPRQRGRNRGLAEPGDNSGEM